MSTPDALAELLEAAGFALTPHRDGRSWVATHADSGQQVEGDSPAEAAHAALALLRQQRSDAERQPATLEEALAEIARLRARLRRGELALSKLLDALDLADGHARHDPRRDAPGYVRLPAEVWRSVAGSRKAARDAWSDEGRATD
jgi:succinate dehydrogenase/fumarate reductase flavoprotein subunit